jgi:hypothetical protein
MKKVHEETLLELRLVKQHLKKVMEEHGHTIQQLKKKNLVHGKIRYFTSFLWENRMSVFAAG